MLYRNKRFLRSIFDSIQVGVGFTLPSGSVDINNKDMEIFSVTRGEALSDSISTEKSARSGRCA